jgi:hypothetical protein
MTDKLNTPVKETFMQAMTRLFAQYESDAAKERMRSEAEQDYYPSKPPRSYIYTCQKQLSK